MDNSDKPPDLKDFVSEFMESESRLRRVEGEKPSKRIKCKIRRMYLVALSALLLALTMGLSTGYSAPATYDMVNRPNSSFKPTPKQIMWIGSSLAIGMMTGSIIAGYLADKIGRKDTTMLNLLPSVIGWLIICYSNNLSAMIIGRLLCGVSCGILSVTVPVYLVEISTVEVRGILGSSFQGFLTIGNLISVTVGAYISWKYLALHGTVVCFFAAICFFSMPETPRWLLMKNKMRSAVRVMKTLQGDFVDPVKECEAIYKDLKAQSTEKISLVEFTRPQVIKPALIGITLMLVYEFSGANAVFLYSSSIFDISKNFLDPKKSTIILGAVQVFATLVSNLIVDKAGRKILLILSGSLMAISLTVFGTYYYKTATDANFQGNYDWIPLVSLIIFIIAFSIGYGPIPHLIVPEMLPIRVRSTMCAVIQVFNGLFAFIVTNTFSDLQNLLGNYGAFWFYSAVCVIGVLFIVFVVPETKGKRLEEIENLFCSKTRKEVIINASEISGGPTVIEVQGESLPGASVIGMIPVSNVNINA